jgi:hypothetical protein
MARDSGRLGTRQHALRPVRQTSTQELAGVRFHADHESAAVRGVPKDTCHYGIFVGAAPRRWSKIAQGNVRGLRWEESAHRTLDKWTNRGPLMVRPLWEAKEGNAKKLKSALVRGAQRVQAIEEDRRRGKLKRIG